MNQEQLLKEEDKERKKQAHRRQMIRESNQKNAQLLPLKPKVRYQWEELSKTALMLLATRKRGETTELLVQHIQRECHIYTTRDDEKPEMWIYESGVYKPEGRTYIAEICRELLGEAFSTSLCNDVIRKVEADTYVDQDEFFRRQEQYPHLLPVQNGVLDIKSRELHPFHPNWFFFNKIPVTYDSKKDCTAIQQFFKQVLAKDEDIQVMQEFFGFSLLREYKYEKSLMLLGSGRNGKGKTLDLLRRFIGPENCASISLEDIEKDQFAIGEMHNKLVNISGDISNAAISNSGTFKMLTGRDIVQAARKFKTRVQFVNYAKMVFAANELPRSRDMTNAFFDRWILLEFPFRFLPQKELDAIDHKERSKVRLQNPAIIEELTTSSELSGLLNWALDGFKRLQETKDFSYSPTSQKVKELWIRRSDSFMAFCLDHVQEDWDGEVSKSDLRHAYADYCRLNKLKGVSDKVIKHVLEEQFGVADQRSSTGEREMVWKGIQLKSVKDVKDVNGFSSNYRDGNSPIKSNTLDKYDTLDKQCVHGNSNYADCLLCMKGAEHVSK